MPRLDIDFYPRKTKLFNKGIFGAPHAKPRQVHQPMRNPPKATTINHVSIKEEIKEWAQIYTALDPSGCNRQYSIIKVHSDYDGKPLSFLIDSRSSHSFLSPHTTQRLQVETHPIGRKLQASLANGSTIQMDEQIVDLIFQLEGHSTK